MGFTFIDLFCGCGGFSLGMKKAGFHELASIDFDPHATHVFKHNFPESGVVFARDIATIGSLEFMDSINHNPVDVIVGGPPCQGFSIARRVDGSNHGDRLIDDSRRDLYVEYLRFLDFIEPKAFIFENVLGITSTSGGAFLERIINGAQARDYHISKFLVNVSDFAVPQKRRRIILIGTREKRFNLSYTDIVSYAKLEKPMMLGEAIMDLPEIHAGGGSEIMAYDLLRRQKHLEKYGNRFISFFELQDDVDLYNHKARVHSERDIRDFSRLSEGETSAQALKRGQFMEFPYKRDHFKDRYTKQHREKLSSTIVAHMAKDGLMFIHPTQERTLTPREAARLQSFPDWFTFPVPPTHQYKLIGNAIPPRLAYFFGLAIKDWLES